MTDLPSPKEISSLLRDLLGRQVSVNDNRARFTGDVLWARYATANDTEEAVWTWDVAAGINVGAALTMVPADQAAQDIRRRAVDAMALENFQEVANILSSVLNDQRKVPFVLKEVGYDDAKKGKMAEKNKSLKDKASYTIEIDGYGGGATQLRCSGS